MSNDNILVLIDEMKALSLEQRFEDAKKVLDKIKTELEKPEPERFLISIVDTVKDVYKMIKRDHIRLDPDDYDFGAFLNLVMNVWKRRDELQGAMYHDTERQRRVVAEEMYGLGMTIAPKTRRFKRMPNKRFLEVCYSVNPSITSDELLRRAKVKLYLGLKAHDKIEDARKELKKYSGHSDLK